MTDQTQTIREIANEMSLYTLMNRDTLHPVVRHQIDHWAERLLEQPGTTISPEKS